MKAKDYWDTVMEGFIRYFQQYADWLPGVIKGASPSRITYAETLVDQPLPPEYRAFLACMGDTPRGALDPFLENVSFGIDAVEAMYTQAGFCAPRGAVFQFILPVNSG